MPDHRDWQALFQDIVGVAFGKTCYHSSKRGRLREHKRSGGMRTLKGGCALCGKTRR